MPEPTQAELLAQLAAMQAQVAKLQQQLTTQQSGSGGLAQDESVAAGKEGIAAGGDISDNTITRGDHNVTGNDNVVYNIASIVIGEAPVTMTAVDRESALGRYLHHVISRNRYLQLQGIRSGGKLVHIELDHIYIRRAPPNNGWLKRKNVGWPRKRCWPPVKRTAATPARWAAHALLLKR